MSVCTCSRTSSCSYVGGLLLVLAEVFHSGWFARRRESTMATSTGSAGSGCLRLPKSGNFFLPLIFGTIAPCFRGRDVRQVYFDAPQSM